jgi:hypothetical protein
MSRFFFDSHDGSDLLRDQKGLELTVLEALVEDAVDATFGDFPCRAPSY